MPKPLSPSLVFVLKSFIPYSKESMLLGFSPNRYFNELEKRDRFTREQIRNSYYTARRQNYLSADAIPRLTAKGLKKLEPFIAKRLGPNARLMVIFDIPEEKAELRRQFRTLLRELKFEQAQQSVWISDYDHREVLRKTCIALNLYRYVQVHESALLFPVKKDRY